MKIPNHKIWLCSTLHGGTTDALASLARGLGVNTQRKAASAGLARVTLAKHVALGLGDARAALQLVATEALTGILSTGQAEALGLAVCNALGVGDFAVADVRKADAGEGTSIEVIGEAALVRPACWGRGRSTDRSRYGDSGHDNLSCGDPRRNNVANLRWGRSLYSSWGRGDNWLAVNRLVVNRLLVSITGINRLGSSLGGLRSRCSADNLDNISDGG